MKNSFFKYQFHWILVIILLVVLVMVYLFFSNSFFRSDRLLVLFVDEAGRRNSLMIQLSRYDVFPHRYNYTYSYNLMRENSKTLSGWIEYTSFDTDFKERGFLSEISNINNENTLNENYLLRLEIDGREFKIDLKNMTGDFLVNNSLERFTYLNMGNTMIIIDGKEYSADFALNKTASSDYLKLQREQAVDSVGSVMFLSDEQGGLYYVDITDVPDKSSRYSSHKWALYKKGDTLKKDVSNISLMRDGNEQMLNLPIFEDASLKINNSINSFSEKVTYSLLSGDLIDNNGEKRITGFGLNYGEK